MGTPHCSLEKDHYHEVRSNPMYVMEGMSDVLREEMMMNMPIPQVIQPPTEISKELPPMAWHQVRNEVRSWRKKHAELLKEIDILKAKVDRSTKKYNKYY